MRSVAGRYAKLKKIILFPFLFITYGVLNAVLNNLDQIDPVQAVRPLIVLVSFTIVGILLFRIIFRDWHYAAYLAFLILAFNFISGHLVRIFETGQNTDPEVIRLSVMLILGIVLLILGIRQVWRRFGGASVVTPVLNILLVLAIISQLAVTLPELIPNVLSSSSEQDGEIPIPETGGLGNIDCSNRPDIYYLILDAYGRSDVLEELYGLDNEPFLSFLESQGFFIASQGHSNYIQTIFSVSSSLNMKFIEPEPPGVSGSRYYSQLISDNEVMSLLDGCGYETVAFETGFFFTNHPHVDTFISSQIVLSEFESLLLAGTPVESLVGLIIDRNSPDRSYQAHRERILKVFDELERLPRRNGPQFIFAHIISPHPPFVFDASGDPIQPGRSYSIADGNEFSGTWEEYRKGYAGQVQFVNRMLQTTIETILADSAEPPIIILQGDHGPGGNLNWRSPDQTCLWERTSILNAYYLPEGSDQLVPSITPVNSFRVILNAYFGTDLELLPDNTYFTSHLLPREVIDVTDKRSSREQCLN
jgi:hypothetical protein